MFFMGVCSKQRSAFPAFLNTVAYSCAILPVRYIPESVAAALSSLRFLDQFQVVIRIPVYMYHRQTFVLWLCVDACGQREHISNVHPFALNQPTPHDTSELRASPSLALHYVVLQVP